MFDIKRMPTHPGEILREEFMAPMGLTQTGLARDLKTSFRTINEIVNGKRAITPDLALRLSKFFGTSEELWLNLQNQYDLYKERVKKSSILNKIVPYSKLRKAIA